MAYLSELDGSENVVLMREVPDLNDFFSQVDVFLVVNSQRLWPIESSSIRFCS